MILKHERTYFGANPFSARPVVVVSFVRPRERLWRSQDLPELTRRLKADPFRNLDAAQALDPAMHVMSLTRFLLSGLGGKIRDYRIATSASRSYFVVGFFSPRTSLAALDLAVEILGAFAKEPPRDTVDRVADFLRSNQAEHPDYQANILMDYAEVRQIPFFRYAPNIHFWQFGWGANAKVYTESLSADDSAIAFLLQRDKQKSKSVFRALGVPTPAYALADDIGVLAGIADTIGYPCVVKPIDRGGGKGVTADVGNLAELEAAFIAARTRSKSPILVEKWVPGEEHRIMVVNGEFVCAIRRSPSTVTGDGRSTITALIDRLNKNRNANPALGQPRPMLIDDALGRHLRKSGYSLDSVLPAGSNLVLRSVSNLSMGGIAHDVTRETHPEVRAMVEHMARTLRFGTAGFDYITSDIGKSPREAGGTFLEMNTTPGLDICLAGKFPIDRVLEKMFGKRVGRIPAYLHVLPEGARIRMPDRNCRLDHAIVNGAEIRVGATEYRVADPRGWAAVSAALRNQTVRSLDIYAGTDEIVTRGLPLDRFDKIVLADPAFPRHWLPVLERGTARFSIARLAERALD